MNALRIRTRDWFGADERAFLPAAHEVMESPPNPLGRTMVYALCLVAFAGLGWATIGQVDIVAVASGKIVSHVRTQPVQPFETATVTAVLVRSGQQVHAGEPLIELDKTAALAERDHAGKDLVAALLDQMRLTAFLAGAVQAPFATVPDATPLDVERAQAQLTAQVSARAGQLADLAQQRLQRQAEREALERNNTKIEQTLPMVAERADIRAKAADLGNASVLAKLESAQLLVETRAELRIGHSKLAALDAAIEGLEQKYAATDADIRTNAMTELARAQQRIRDAREALAKAEHRADLQTLRAPIDGTVQQVHVASVGSVVTPAQQLLSIVPDDGPVEVEAVLENRDVGFVTAGQPVEIKIEAYPFTRYGLMSGTVRSVDRDAEAEGVDQSVRGSERPADQTDNVEKSERLHYTVHIRLAPGSLDVDGHAATLLPGMAVKAEIKTGKRRIIDFLLAPLREHLHDALRER